jgi:hypothetical protein
MVDLKPNEALRVYNGHTLEGTVHTKAGGHIRLVVGEDLQITKAGTTRLHPIEPRCQVKLLPDDVTLEMGSEASYTALGGWTLHTSSPLPKDWCLTHAWFDAFEEVYC